MNRQEFTLKYLIALYHVHRRNRDALASINTLKSFYALPEDAYLEAELPEMLRHRSWALIGGNDGPFGEWDLRITTLGKEAAESQLDSGNQVYPIDPAAANTIDERELKDSIPASDRIVLISDNQDSVFHVKNTISELSQQLADGNDFGEMNPIEVEEARREIYFLQQAFDAERVRIDWIGPLGTKSLKWVAEKAAGAAAGKLALAALTALVAWLGLVG